MAYTSAMVVRFYSSKEAAKIAGIHWVTLIRWLSSGKYRPPEHKLPGATGDYLWTDKEIKRLCAFVQTSSRRGGLGSPRAKK